MLKRANYDRLAAFDANSCKPWCNIQIETCLLSGGIVCCGFVFATGRIYLGLLICGLFCVGLGQRKSALARWIRTKEGGIGSNDQSGCLM